MKKLFSLLMTFALCLTSVTVVRADTTSEFMVYYRDGDSLVNDHYYPGKYLVTCDSSIDMIEVKDSNGSSYLADNIDGDYTFTLPKTGDYLVTAYKGELAVQSMGFTVSSPAPIIESIPSTFYGIIDYNKYSNTGTQVITKVKDFDHITIDGNYCDTQSVFVSDEGWHTVSAFNTYGLSKSVDLCIDKSNPKTNIKAKTYTKTVRIKASDKVSGVSKIKLNGKTIKNNKYLDRSGKYTLKIWDKAGNMKRVKFRLKIKYKPVTLKASKYAVSSTIKTYKSKVTISMSGSRKVTLNGKVLKESKTIKKNGIYVLKVINKSGDTKVIRFKVKIAKQSVDSGIQYMNAANVQIISALLYLCVLNAF